MHKILLVDDTRHFLDLETSFLQRADCRILTASTGLEAVRVARADRPDLIVLDIEMPEMNGIQACRILKGDAATQAIPIVILTSMQMEDEARRAGADHFLRKPIDEPRFLAEVRKFLPIVERNDPRVPASLALATWRGGEPGEAQLVNLSRTGFYATTPAPPPVGARLEVSFTLPGGNPGKLISAEVLVVRVGADGAGFAARFFRISSGARLFVDEFVDKGIPSTRPAPVP